MYLEHTLCIYMKSRSSILFYMKFCYQVRHLKKDLAVKGVIKMFSFKPSIPSIFTEQKHSEK